MKLGEFEILPVLDGEVRADPSRAYRGTTPEQWDLHKDLLEPDGMLVLALGGFLVRGGPEDRVVLIDLGLGHQMLFRQQAGGRMIEGLAALGVTPEQITDVLFSHLHFDHVGWASEDGKPVFANATYRSDRRDWDYFVHGPGSARPEAAPDAVIAKDLLEPAADRFEFWSEAKTLLPGIDLMHTPGHTPGSTTFVISSAGRRAVLLGDVVHCPIELVEDEWAGLGDVDPELAKRTKNALARELEGKDVPVSAAHFPGLRFGRLVRAEGKRRWVL